MECFFNCDEDKFKELSKKNKIEWNIQFKNNKNSIIEYGKDSKNTLLCLKSIPVSNQDFEYINNFPKNGDITTCWRELYIYQNMESIHKEYKSFNYLSIYTSFISTKEGKPYLSLLFPYIPLTLRDIMVYNSFSTKDINYIYIQIFFLGYYLSLKNIKHNDIHIDNILVDILEKKIDLYFVFENRKYILPKQTTVLYLIDFGIAEITTEFNPEIFKEWVFFFEKLEELFQIPPLFSKCSSFREIFKYILQFKILKPDYSNILSLYTDSYNSGIFSIK